MSNMMSRSVRGELAAVRSITLGKSATFHSYLIRSLAWLLTLCFGSSLPKQGGT